MTNTWNKKEIEELLWKVREFHLNNPTGSGGYSENYCKAKLRSWISENIKK